MAIVHELSWSSSRARTFRECRRRYYYDYYHSWGGWARDADPERRRSYLLKKMTRMPMLAGQALHDALQGWFTARVRGRRMEPAAVAEGAVAALRAGYKQSRDGEWRRRPSKLVRLAEHHYGEEQIDEASGAAGEYGKRYVERIRAGVEDFFALAELEGVRTADPEDYLALEEMGTIELFGTKVFAIPDCAVREKGAVREEGRVAVYDWKSGRPAPADRFQLQVYVLYAGEVWGAEPEQVECVDVYLGRGEVVRERFTRADADQVLGEVERSIAEMRALHFDADRSAGDREAFAMIPEGSPEARACRTCNYRELCGRA